MLKVNNNDFPNSVSCHKENEHDPKHQQVLISQNYIKFFYQCS